MGTNYYLHRNICSHCGRGDDPIHIGKSSAGWCFALHVDDEITSLADWQTLWGEPNSKILNEYDEEISADQMIKIITGRWASRGELGDAWYALNHAQRGPNGLARHTIDGRHCIGHGDGTYDLMMGEFS